MTSKQLDLTWTASSDNTGVHAYRVYRDGVLAATVGTPAYSDTDAPDLGTFTSPEVP